jgi:hypothetical protein
LRRSQHMSLSVGVFSRHHTCVEFWGTRVKSMYTRVAQRSCSGSKWFLKCSTRISCRPQLLFSSWCANHELVVISLLWSTLNIHSFRTLPIFTQWKSCWGAKEQGGKFAKGIYILLRHAQIIAAMPGVFFSDALQTTHQDKSQKILSPRANHASSDSCFFFFERNTKFGRHPLFFDWLHRCSEAAYNRLLAGLQHDTMKTQFSSREKI